MNLNDPQIAKLFLEESQNSEFASAKVYYFRALCQPKVQLYQEKYNCNTYFHHHFYNSTNTMFITITKDFKNRSEFRDFCKQHNFSAKNLTKSPFVADSKTKRIDCCYELKEFIGTEALTECPGLTVEISLKMGFTKENYKLPKTCRINTESTSYVSCDL